MEILDHIIPGVTEVEFRRPSVKLFCICISVIFFICVFGFSHFMGILFKTYRTLDKKEQIFWNLAIVRAVYGIFCTVIGIWSFFIDSELEKDIVFGTTPTSYFALTATVGFFCFECLAVSISDIVYKRFSILLNIHHWISLVGFSILLIEDSSHYFGTRGLLLEMSTPFSAVCWIFLKAGKADTLFWKVNQFLLVHSFHLRSVVECSIWYVTYKHWNIIWETMPVAFFVCLYIQLTLVTFWMTPYWTYKKTVQMITPVDWNFEDVKTKTKTS